MSSLLTKLINSFVGASFVSQQNVSNILNFDKFANISNISNLVQSNIFQEAFLGTYTAMNCFDIYRMIYGTTKTIITQDSVGHFVYTKYNVQYIDMKPQLGLISGLTSAVIGYCTGNNPVKYSIMGAIGSEIIADALNFDPVITAHEINGDDSFVIM